MNGLTGLRAVLEGELLTPTTPGYDAARRPALARYEDVRPRAVVRCASEQDIARTIAFARNTGAHVVPRSGGHCFAGRSSTTGLVLDLGRLDGSTVDASGRAVIGAGARLAQVYDALHHHGRTIPAGCGSTVGIGGLALGGGLGLIGRRHGLTSDALIGARVVLADGRVVECDDDREPELFWALRGAGGGQFGVVSSLVFATVAEPVATRFELCWPSAAAAEVVAAWQDWAPGAPDDITANLTVSADPGGPLRVVVFGAALRDAAATSVLLDKLVRTAGSLPRTDLRDGLAVRDLKRSFDARGEHDLHMTHRSEFFAQPLPTGAIGTLLDELMSGSPHGHRELSFTAMGGAYNRIAPDATAFVHRRERFLLDHAAIGDPWWIDRSWGLAHTHASGRVYPNFPDPRLGDPATAYHGDNRSRLAAAKRAHDPDRLFDFPQAV